MAAKPVQSTRAPYGDKTIEITIRLWTDGIATNKNEILSGHAWTSGNVGFHSNKSHGIKASDPKNFNSIAEIGAKIEALLLREGIRLHQSPKLKKLYSE